MVIIVAEQAIAQLLVVRQLPIEAEAEPLVLDQVVPFERLRVAAIIFATRGVTHMPNRRVTRVFPHQILTLGAMR